MFVKCTNNDRFPTEKKTHKITVKKNNDGD